MTDYRVSKLKLGDTIMGDWIKQIGNFCPVSADTKVDVEWNSGHVVYCQAAHNFSWYKGNNTVYIVNYRVSKPEPTNVR